MDFDLTQAIPLSDVESDVTDDLDESLSKKPIGFIKTIKQKGYPETTFPIYEGVNLIGRGDAANVVIPLKALSKEHACIEADGESIFIYDKGSRNKTRRGKLFLKPNVRYELKDNDNLIFGDVKCEFLINHGQEEAKNDDMGTESNSGSETGSECMLQINVVLPSGSSSGVTDTKSKPANNYACIMSPDQKQTNKRTASETFVEESFLEDKEKKGNLKDSEDQCSQTPSVSSNHGEHRFGNAAKRLCGTSEGLEKQLLGNRKLIKDIIRQQEKMQSSLDAIMVALNCRPVQLPVPSAKLRPEVVHADSEGYINLGGNKISPPLLFSLEVYKDLLTANPKPTLLLKALMGVLFSKEEMATSNYGGKKEIFAEDSGSDTDIEDGLQQSKQADTSKFVPDSQPTLNISTIQESPFLPTRASRFNFTSCSEADKDVDQTETQIYDGTENRHSTPASKDQEKNIKSEVNIFANEPTQACTMDDISTLKYNTASDTDDEEVDKAGLVSAPTQPCTVAEAATQRYGDGDETDEDVDAGVANAPTLAYTVTEAATQMYGEQSDTEDGNVASEGRTAAPTLTYDNTDENISKNQSCEDAKEGNSDGDKTDDEVDLAGLATAPTQAYTVAEAATQRYSDGDETDEEVDLAGLATAPTQAYTVAEAATQRYSDGDETDEEVDLAGLATAPTQAYTVAEAATQKYDDREETDEDVDAEIAAAPTQAYMAAEAATQRYGEESDSEDAASGGLAAAPTLAYDNIDEKEAEDSNGKKEAVTQPNKTVSKTVNDGYTDDQTLAYGEAPVEPQVQGNLEDAPTQVFGVDDETAATQAFGEDDETAAMQAFGEDDETAATQAFGEDDETAATQAFGVDDETAATQAFGEDDETAATQAFGEDDETAATQAFGEDDETAATQVFGDNEQGPGPARHVVGCVKEQKPSAQPQPDELIETQAYGVEDEPADTAESNTLEIDVTGDTQIPDSEETDELEIESILRKVPGKSVLASPEKKGKNQEKKRVVFSSVPKFEPQGKSNDLKEGKKNTKGKKQKGIKDKKEGDDKEVLDASRRSGRSHKQTTRMKDSVDQNKRRSISSNAEMALSKSKDENIAGNVSENPVVEEQPVKDVSGKKSLSQSGEKKVLAVEEQSNDSQSVTARKRQQVEEGKEEKDSDETNTTQKTVTQTPRGKSNRTRNMKSSVKEHKIDKVGGEEHMEEKQTRGRRSKRNIGEEKEGSTKTVEDAFETGNTIQNTVAQTPRGRSNKTRNIKNSLKEDMVDKTGGEEHLEEKPTRGSRSKRNIVEEEKEESRETVKGAFETDNTLQSTVAETPRGRRNKTNNMKTSLIESGVDKIDRDEQMEEKQTRGRGSKRKVVEEDKIENTKTVKDAFETDNTIQSTVAETPRGRSNKTKITDKTDKDERKEEKQTRGRGSKRKVEEEEKQESTKTSKGAFETDITLQSTVAETPRGRSNKTKVTDKTDRDDQTEERQTTGRGSKRKVVEEEKVKITEPKSRISKRGKSENSEENDSQKIAKNKSSTICQSPTPSKKARKTHDEDLPCSPSLRKRANDSKPKIMFTGVVDEGWEKIVKSLGGELVTSIHDCTHLITDKIRRTVKFLCGLAKGAYLIDPKWLEESKKRKSFVNPDNFLVTDRASEKQHGFSLKRSHDIAIETRLFEGYKIHVTSSVKPDTNQMKDIIHCAGGEFLSKMPNKYEEKIVVVSSEDDEARCNSALKAGIPIVSSEFILTGILRQENQIEPYRLFIEVPSSASKSKPSASAKKGTTSKRRR